MADDDYLDEFARRWEEEGLFARDSSGQLIRAVAATHKQLTDPVAITLDGREFGPDQGVTMAVPTTDAQGNVVYLDANGTVKPRRTTIYDAVRTICGKHPELGDARALIPTLCHADHLHPVGVCRVCMVEISKKDRSGKLTSQLAPSCVHPVEKNMIVGTLRNSQMVRDNVKVLLELLSADHLRHPSEEPRKQSDLERLITRFQPDLNLRPERMRRRKPVVHRQDTSSQIIAVNHDDCILCDRCVRACTDVKQNFVIGRSGKGYTTRIGFDLNDPMGESSCVGCGECMLSCPTSALTFHEEIRSEWWEEEIARPGRSAVLPEEMDNIPLLKHLPYGYRQWNQRSIVRWEVQEGDELCSIGEYGSTAFIIERGQFNGWGAKSTSSTRPAGGLGGWLGGLFAGRGASASLGPPLFQLAEPDLIFGEMTCMSLYPRNATVRAATAGVVYIIRRNVLFELQRNPDARQRLDDIYRTRAIDVHLDNVKLFAPLGVDERNVCKQFLRSRAKIIRLEPKQVIFRQGELADCFYMIRFGNVKVSESFAGEERILTYLRWNAHFGEIGLIADWKDIQRDIPPGLQNRRTANCTALDHVELVRVDKADFLALLGISPTLKQHVLDAARALLLKPAPSNVPRQQPNSAIYRQFTEQGLHNAQKLLVLDLEACTRCDECTRACADTHQDLPRFVREGLRFDKWLVASACRSCTDPVCMIGCPVDAIHRKGGAKEIIIENHCIGCGLCANNCPYGNINMAPYEAGRQKREGRTLPVVKSRATMCDLCHDLVDEGKHEEVSCVHACPHNAAFRMSGEELLQKLLPPRPA